MVDQLALDVGERVRFHRLAAKKTQNVVAGLAGITTDYLYQIERGKELPTVPVLVAIANALDVPPAALINKESHESPDPIMSTARSALCSGINLGVSRE